jgi:PAS domain S-box-containing protein
MTFDALDAPIVMVNHAGEITRLNEAGRRLAGQSHADVLGRNLGALEPMALWARASELVGRVSASGSPASAQVRNSGDGQTWDLQVHPVAGPRAGRTAAIVIAHNVTSVVRLQDSVRRNEAMAAMGALVAGVAHEVRNPLFSMTATLDAFEARQGAARADQRHVGVLRAQLERLRQLMRDLLDFGKPAQVAIAPVEFDEVVRQAVDESALVARERGVRGMRSHLPPAIRGPPACPGLREPARTRDPPRPDGRACSGAPKTENGAPARDTVEDSGASGRRICGEPGPFLAPRRRTGVGRARAADRDTWRRRRTARKAGRACGCACRSRR